MHKKYALIGTQRQGPSIVTPSSMILILSAEILVSPLVRRLLLLGTIASQANILCLSN